MYFWLDPYSMILYPKRILIVPPPRPLQVDDVISDLDPDDYSDMETSARRSIQPQLSFSGDGVGIGPKTSRAMACYPGSYWCVLPCLRQGCSLVPQNCFISRTKMNTWKRWDDFCFKYLRWVQVFARWHTEWIQRWPPPFIRVLTVNMCCSSSRAHASKRVLFSCWTKLEASTWDKTPSKNIRSFRVRLAGWTSDLRNGYRSPRNSPEMLMPASCLPLFLQT